MSLINNIRTSLLPFLVVSPCIEAIEFYQSAYDAIVQERHAMPAGKLMARLSIDGQSFWIGDEEEEFDNISPFSFKGTAVRMILVTADPGKVFDKALQLGATQLCPMTREEAWLIGKLRDPFGHVWEIGHPL